MSVFDGLGVRTIINAKGTATRLSGGILRPEVAAAMAEASQSCVDMAELQAAASRVIADVTGAEAGYIASGASACLLLATAACIAGLDPGRMARLPDTRGLRNEVIMVRSQRNFYDHAIRAAGATIVEVGLPDRYSGAGVRDAESWEIEDAITDNTAAIHYVADAAAQPPLAEVVAIARRYKIPVFVDAAAQLPPQSNLKRFIAEGADLVAFSGGKVIGGPQASGILCGKRDLVMSAALQHLDLDVFAGMWTPPASLIDKHRLKGTPQHGIGRSCKAGKEEIAGLLTALRLFVAEGDKARHGRWLSVLREVERGLQGIKASVSLEGGDDPHMIPVLALGVGAGRNATDVALALQAGTPSVHLDPVRRAANVLLVNPVCVKPDDVAALVAAIRAVLV